MEELIGILKSQKELHNRTDTDNRKRLIRAVEIALYYNRHPEFDHTFPKINSCIFQVIFDRNQRRRRISERLKQRLEEGMIDEVKTLIDNGVDVDVLKYYGLEYKFITKYPYRFFIICYKNKRRFCICQQEMEQDRKVRALRQEEKRGLVSKK